MRRLTISRRLFEPPPPRFCHAGWRRRGQRPDDEAIIIKRHEGRQQTASAKHTRARVGRVRESPHACCVNNNLSILLPSCCCGFRLRLALAFARPPQKKQVAVLEARQTTLAKKSKVQTCRHMISRGQ